MIATALTFLFKNGILPAALTAAGVAFPPFGFLLGFPFVGDWIRKGIASVVGNLIENGVIELKVELIDRLSEKAQAEYAPEIALLREWQMQDFLTPEQEKEYADKLNELVKSRPGIVNS